MLLPINVELIGTITLIHQR